MSKLLTIAIPTYNRAELLDQQLSWLERSIKGFESDCEVLVADNCSSDHTPEIIEKWQKKLINLTFKSHKHPQHLGIMQNIMYCLNSAATQYVWAIGVDDHIQDRTIADVIDKLKQQQNLSLLFLNFSGCNKITGHPIYPPSIIGNRWFDADCEDGCSDGKAIFEHCFAKSLGAVIFLSASIYRTDLIKRALQNWSDAANNWMSLAYIAGYCAAHGNVIVTKKTYLECAFGATFWHKKPKAVLLMQYKHIPEVISKLEASGYSQEFCRRILLQFCQEIDTKVLLNKLRRWPIAAIRTVMPFLILVRMATVDLVFFQ
ncbi:glycosyltransferase family 2 protein [Anabaena sp. CA = ATCC 33047]|uniref:glycosyltransferase family 2 protein n=1 Tax=Anabaena sp. (strain CA / ATCC 33047) TaxID=52271 RepID=UPI00082AA230|nr:glycosyltransferase [Anabaena sp. CA = ATCC 33047]